MYQVQTLTIGVQPLSSQEQANVRALFLAARAELSLTAWASGGQAVTNAPPRVRRAEPKSTEKRSSVRRWIAPAPALITMIGIVVFGVAVTFQQSSRTEARYREEANACFTIGDYTTARLCFERLLQTTQTDPVLWYGLARSLDGLHQVSESVRDPCQIAQSDAGYPPAQLWLAEQLLESGHSNQGNQLAEQHLRRVIEAEPENAECARG